MTESVHKIQKDWKRLKQLIKKKTYSDDILLVGKLCYEIDELIDIYRKKRNDRIVFEIRYRLNELLGEINRRFCCDDACTDCTEVLDDLAVFRRNFGKSTGEKRFSPLSS